MSNVSNNNVNNNAQVKELKSIVKELIKSIHNAENFEGLKVSLTDKFGNMMKNNAPKNNTPRNNTPRNNATNASQPSNVQPASGGKKKKTTKKRSSKK